MFRKRSTQVEVNFDDMMIHESERYMFNEMMSDFNKRGLKPEQIIKEVFQQNAIERQDNQRLREAKKEVEKKAEEDRKRAIEEIQKREREKEDLLLNKNTEIERLNNTVQKQGETLQKQGEIIQGLREEIRELNERNRKKDEEEKAKAEKREKRKEYDRRTDKKVMARDYFETEKDYQMFMKEFKKMHYVDYVFCSFERYTLLRKEDNLKMTYNEIKDFSKKYELDNDSTLKTLTLKTGAVVQLLFPKTLTRILDEYFMRVKRENIFIDDSTCLFIEYKRNKKQKQNLKKVVKRKKISEQFINKHLQECLKTFHDNGKLLYLKRIGTHSFRITGARLLHNIGVRIEVISRWLGHKSVKTTMIYLRIADKDLKESVRVLNEYQERMFGNEVY